MVYVLIALVLIAVVSSFLFLRWWIGADREKLRHAGRMDEILRTRFAPKGGKEDHGSADLGNRDHEHHQDVVHPQGHGH